MLLKDLDQLYKHAPSSQEPAQARPPPALLQRWPPDSNPLHLVVFPRLFMVASKAEHLLLL